MPTVAALMITAAKTRVALRLAPEFLYGSRKWRLKRGIGEDPRARKERIDENYFRRPQESGSLPRWYPT